MVFPLFKWCWCGMVMMLAISGVGVETSGHIYYASSGGGVRYAGV